MPSARARRATPFFCVPAWQVAQLPRLQRLLLDQCDYSPDSLSSQLSALSGSLTRLEVSEMELPSQEALAALTRLQHLD